MGNDHCQTARFWQYHAYGWGIVGVRSSIERVVGSAVHDMLAETVKDPLSTRPDPWPQRIATVGERRQETLITIKEQQHLAQALALGWLRTNAAEWLQPQFDIVSIEQEYSMELDDGRLLLMVKPDLVVRNKQTGRLSIPDYKTMSYFDEKNTPAQYRDDVQMATITAVVEEALQEPVEDYYILALVKGQRKKFIKAGIETPERRQYSHLCWAMAPDPPTRPRWRTEGYWFDKQPVWEAFSAYDWVKQLDMPLLRGMFPIMGPYKRPTHMIQQALRSIVGGERRFIEQLQKFRDSGLDEDTVDGRQLLDSLFTRSYGHCVDFYGDECPMTRICFSLPGGDKPLDSGFYKLRRPHHVPEQELMVKLGNTLPGEEWE